MCLHVVQPWYQQQYIYGMLQSHLFAGLQKVTRSHLCRSCCCLGGMSTRLLHQHCSRCEQCLVYWHDASQNTRKSEICKHPFTGTIHLKTNSRMKYVRIFLLSVSVSCTCNVDESCTSFILVPHLDLFLLLHFLVLQLDLYTRYSAWLNFYACSSTWPIFLCFFINLIFFLLFF